MSMEEMRALSWRKKQLLSKFMWLIESDSSEIFLTMLEIKDSGIVEDTT